MLYKKYRTARASQVSGDPLIAPQGLNFINPFLAVAYIIIAILYTQFDCSRDFYARWEISQSFGFFVSYRYGKQNLL